MTTPPTPRPEPDLPRQLEGRTAIVTGAASGIGRETALLFVRRGARVVAADLAADGLASLADEVADRDRLVTVAADLTADAGPATVVERCVGTFGAPDVLANIAGKAGDRPVADSTDAELALYVDINLGTTFRLSREVVAVMGPDGGSIVNTSSAFGLVGVKGSGPYSAAKGAVTALTRQMAADLGRRSIRVNAVAPGLVETPATAAKIADGLFDDVVTRSRPLPRVGVPGDIARVFAFLASDDSAFVTGVTVPVDGGWSTTRFRE